MGFYFLTRKNFTKKSPKILLNAEEPHTRCHQEWVPEESKSQLLIQIIYLLHAFWAMTPRPSPPYAVSASGLVSTHVKDLTGLGGPNSLKLLLLIFN